MSFGIYVYWLTKGTLKLSFCCVVGCLQRKRRQTDRRNRIKTMTDIRIRFSGSRWRPKIRINTRREHRITIIRVILKKIAIEMM
jgi:hypothetical protein